MIIQCPNCDTKYNFPDEHYKEGRKVKCTICEHVFPLPAESGAEPEPEPQPEPQEDDLFDEDLGDEDLDSLFDEMREPAAQEGGEEAEEEDDLFGDEDEQPPSPAKSGREKSAVQEEFGLDEGEDEGEDEHEAPAAKKGTSSFDLDALTAEESQKSTGKRSKLTVIMGLVTLLVLGGLAYYFLPQFMGDEEPAPEEAETTEEVITTEQIKNFSLEDVKQYYVDNEKVGKLFVVQGKVVNNFSSPKELIKIEANLFDANGVSVVSKTMLIGNTVSLFQLQMLSKDELESAINNKVGILTANTSVPPGGEVPFVIVFYNPPDSVQEFGIKVVSAKDPPKE